MKTVLKTLSVMLSLVLILAIAYAETNTEPELYGADQLTALLSNMDSDIQPGTAGCSLRATVRAAELLKWGMNTTMTADEITETVQKVVGDVSEDRKDDFTEALEDVNREAQNILQGDAASIISEAGCNPDDYNFDGVESVEAFNTVMQAAGINS